MRIGENVYCSTFRQPDVESLLLDLFPLGEVAGTEESLASSLEPRGEKAANQLFASLTQVPVHNIRELIKIL